MANEKCICIDCRKKESDDGYFPFCKGCMTDPEQEKVQRCIQKVRQRVIDSGTDRNGFSNWNPSETTFIKNVIEEFNSFPIS